LPFSQPRLYARLLRWLGPWADPKTAPPAHRRTISIPARGLDERPFDAWVFTPPDIPPIGAYLVAPGLHYEGPADPRLERFLRALAHAGFLVVAPFLPDFIALRVAEPIVPDLARAFDALLALPERPPNIAPGLFSISFGSLPVLRLASCERAHEIGAVVLFGGYGSYGDTLRFCLGEGTGDAARDPLNQPVVLLNLVDVLSETYGDLTAVADAWTRYVKATWGREEMKQESRYRPIAEAFAAEIVDPAQRRLFLQGAGLAPGAMDVCLAALARKTERERFLDPRPHLHGLRCPVHIVHGRDDDVIPFTQADVLAQAMPKTIAVKTHLTGLYHHTSSTGLGALVKQIPALAGEGRALVGILRAIVEGGTRPEAPS